MPIPILLTCVGGTMAPSLLLWLRDRARLPFLIHGADAGPAPIAESLLAGFHQVPMGRAPGYVEALLSAAEGNGIRVIVPGSDEEAFVLSANSARFRAIGCEILASPPEVIATIGSKLITYRILSEAGIPVPEHTMIDKPEDLSQAISGYGYPARSVVLKPTDGRGGRGFFILEGRDRPASWLGTGHRERRLDERTFAETDPDLLIVGETMVMPCLRAPVYDADVLAQKGAVRATVIRRRHNPVGIPWTGNTICRNRAFEDYTRAAAEALGLDGLHDIDLMSDAEGRPALLEVNPRMSGSLAATLAADISILDSAIAARIGVDLDVSMPDRDIEILPYTEAIAL